MKKGEKIYRLTANRTTKCQECYGYIYPGQTFLLDKIPYQKIGLHGKVYTQIHNHIIHEGHWKGPKNMIIDYTKRVLAKK